MRAAAASAGGESTLLTAGPHGVVEIDDVAVLVFQGLVPVRMAVRLRSFPTLVRVLVVLVVDMQVLVIEGLVQVLQIGGIAGWPHHQGDRRCRKRHECQHHEGRRRVNGAAQPPGQGISKQPATVRQGKLGGKEGRPIALARGMLQELPRRRLYQ